MANLLVSTIKGLKWSSISQVGRQLLQYLTTLILVALISPDEFGIMAMAIIVIGFLDIFKDLGTSAAIIQLQNPSEELKSSVFWLNVLIGLIIAAMIFFSSPILASIYNSPKVQPVLEVLSITFFVSAFSILQKTLLEKEFQFQKLSVIELISSALGFSVAIVLAFNGFGVWSLVFQVLVNTLVSTMLIWISSDWRPKFQFRLVDIKTISNFSLNLVGFNIINYFARNGDYFLIGKFLGERELGHYYLAYRILLYPIQNITAVISRVLYPSYSKIQNDNIKIGKVFTSTTNAIALLTFPMMAGLSAISFLFARVFFVGEWNTELIGMLILILAPVGALQSVISPVGLIYKIKSKTDWMFRWSLFASSLTILGFIIGLRWGVLGVALSYLITNILIIYPVFKIPFSIINQPVLTYFKSFLNTVFVVICMAILVQLVIFIIGETLIPELKVVILIVSGIVIYILFTIMINKKTLNDMKSIFNNYILHSKLSSGD